jgi:hypothetical protein
MHRQSNFNFWQNEPKFQRPEFGCACASGLDRVNNSLSTPAHGRRNRGIVPCLPALDSVAGIIVRCIAPATSARGGGRPASTRSRLPAGYGKRHTEWRNVRLDGRPGRMTGPHPGIQRRTPPPQPPKKKAPCRIFPASRDRPAGCLRIVNVEA